MLSLLLFFFAVPAVLGSNVFELDANTFDNYIQDKAVMLVDFYAPWCGHCQRLAPELENAAAQLATTKHEFVFAKVDCIQPQNAELCKKFNVQGYPALKLFKAGTYTGDYIGERTAADLVNYMDSVAETSRQRAPLTTGPGSFAQLVGANPQAYVNPQQPQFQPMAPQAYGMAQQQPNYGAFFNHPQPGPNPQQMQQSFYNQQNTNPTYADQQPKVEEHAPNAPLHLGASPDTLAGKFGGNMLALEILRSKLKMIAAYKNWQKRLKEYKEKMTEAAQMNPYNKNNIAAATKNKIHKPYPAPQKAAYVKPHIKTNHYQVKKYPRAFPKQPVAYQQGYYQNAAAYRQPTYQKPQYGDRRASIYRRKLWDQKRAKQMADYKRKIAAFKAKQYAAFNKYFNHLTPQQQQRVYGRSKIARPETQQQATEPTIVQPQASVASQAVYAVQPQAQDTATAQTQAPAASVSAGYTQPQANYDQAQPQAADQPDVQPAATEPQPQPQAQAQANDLQQQTADQSQSQTPITQPEAQAPAEEPKTQAANDVPKADSKQQSSNGNDASIRDLKHDIENAIQDALKNTETSSEAKPAAKTEAKEQTKVLDISGSGSESGSGVVGGNFADAHVTGGGNFAEVSGSGNDSGSGSGEALNKSKDKSSGEA